MNWKPEVGEGFYCIDINLCGAFTLAFVGAKAVVPFVEEHLTANNCFRTKKEAQAKLKQIKQILKEDCTVLTPLQHNRLARLAKTERPKQILRSK